MGRQSLILIQKVPGNVVSRMRWLAIANRASCCSEEDHHCCYQCRNEEVFVIVVVAIAFHLLMAIFDRFSNTGIWNNGKSLSSMVQKKEGDEVCDVNGASWCSNNRGRVDLGNVGKKRIAERSDSGWEIAVAKEKGGYAATIP
ncbi:hypothetical protein BHM03_00041666 [Ensete ventricosum]|nr:hypothetical protein BHM03_00041666 [Ensete ventricosum]